MARVFLFRHKLCQISRILISTPATHSKLQKSWCSTLNSLIRDKNLILMGPPGCGKTSVGRVLGQKLGCPVIDVDDDVLEKDWNTSVSNKLQEVGDERFLEEEGKALLKFSASGSVISLTGSNPLHSDSMAHTKKGGLVVYLDVSSQDIIERLERMKVDRIVGQRSGASIGELLEKRKRFYNKWHDVRVLCETGVTVEAIAEKDIDGVKRYCNVDTETFVSTKSEGSKGEVNNAKFFSDVVVEGLASDGGLYVPKNGLPKFTAGEWKRLIKSTYVERAQVILERCIHPMDVPAVVLVELLEKAYGDNFACGKIAPVRHLSGNQYILELFHGPTASFKDLALQFTPHLFAYCIPKVCNYLVLVATSGDTGSAVLDGFSRLSDLDRRRIAVFCLYPEEGISQVQKSQIIACQGDNGSALGVHSDFDFCQNAIKGIFNNPNATGFLTTEYGTSLTTANSINWARLLPQVVYHASAYLDLVDQGVMTFGKPVDICIPTGNFGNILAAFYAKHMGIPIRKFICASNQNHVLTDFIKSGHYDLRDRKLLLSSSPAIDILKSSNLERLLHLISNQDGSLIKKLYSQLQSEGHFQLPDHLLKHLQNEFVGGWCSENECLSAIRSVHGKTGYIMDTHTAVAKVVADRVQDRTCPVIISCTAHYSKFAPVILQALRIEEIRKNPLSQLHVLNSFHPLPPSHKSLMAMLKRQESQDGQVCQADSNLIMDHIENYLQQSFLKVH